MTESPEPGESITAEGSDLYFDTSDKLPVIYRKEYNIRAYRLERLHPFDAGKWGNVFKILKKKKLLDDDCVVRPYEASEDDLLKVHTESYIKSLKWSVNVAKITEVPFVALVPNAVIQRKVLKPFRYQVGGTVIAGKCAIERGWSINIGGGFHHCCGERGGGFCAYADITLTVHFLMKNFPQMQNIMIVDLDAHQGNGHERDFIGVDNVYILDAYNKFIYPKDEHAKQAIRRNVELHPYTGDDEYLERITTHLEGALNEFKTDMVIYNAGTDVLKGDPLGLLDISPEGIILRDEIVFSKVRKRGIPIVMVTSGGYQRVTADIIAESIANLHKKGLILLLP